MKVKKQKNKSPAVKPYKYTQKGNLKLPQLLEKRQILEERIEVMSAKGWGTDRSRRALQRVIEDIADIQDRNQIILSRHFIERFRSRVDPEATEETIHKELAAERIPPMLSKLGATGAYPYKRYTAIFNEMVAITLVDNTVPRSEES